jgi:O-antigen ligase
MTGETQKYNLKYKINLINSAKLFLYLFFAFNSFRIGTFFFSQEIHYSGFFNPYTGYFLNISEIFLGIGIILLLIHKLFRGQPTFKITKDFTTISILVFLFSIFFSIFFSIDKTNSLLHTARFIEIAIIYFLIKTKLLNVQTVLKIFLASMAIQSSIAILQYALQSSIGLQFLGEPILNTTTKGVSYITLGQEKILRAYGTFSHPNILGMYLVFAIFILINFYKELKSKILFKLLFILFLATLIITFSRSAWLAFGVGSLIFLFKKIPQTKLKILIPILLGAIILYLTNLHQIILERLFFTSDTALTERLMLNKISIKMFMENPMGIGIGNFTLAMQEYATTKLFPWNFQPVHNAFLLAFTELGITGGITILILPIIALIKSLSRKKILIPTILGTSIIIGASLDHYFLTSPHGQFLILIFLLSKQPPIPIKEF